MKQPRVSIGTIRRGEIIEAAVAIIAEQGIQHLSLSGIETKAGMSRGQLTYYYKTKDEILLAIFDRLLDLLHERTRVGFRGGPGDPNMVRHLLETVLRGPQVNREFHALQYTFLSQMSHRADFRRRLARLYEEWRTGLTENLAGQQDRRSADPRTVASLVQAILHGLAMQLAADPNAFDREEMAALCVQVLDADLKKIEPFSARPSNGAAGAAKKKTGQNRSAGRGPTRRPSSKDRVKHG